MSAPLSLTKQALLAVEQMRERLVAAEEAAREPIAIVGIGLRVPGAAGPDEFWALLRDGVDATTEIPPGRWDVRAYFDADPDAVGKINTMRGGFLPHVDEFDAGFFGVSPREARSMDPQHRLLLEVAWEAIEHAGIAPGDLSGTRTGVFVGLTIDDYLHILVGAGDPKLLDAYAHHGNVLNAAAGRLSYALGLHGPSLAIDTACSSSLVAIHTACQSLRARDCDLALAGGVNLVLSPLSSVRLARGHMLAPDGRCKTFDESADGYARGEGCGVVLLKRLSAARADGDRILAVIRGSAVNQDGRTSALTVPNGLAQRALIGSALANAGVDAADVAYIEAHGTGTALGDPIEMDAIADVLARSRRSPLIVGSVKTNIGHLESAAGVAGVAKVVLALQHGEIPAHLHFRTPSRHIPWAELNVRVPTARIEWPAGARRIAGVSSFGASGTNAHLVLEAAPDPATAPGPDRSQHVLTLSAESEKGLRELAARYARALERSAAPAQDVCFTASVGRSHFVHRAAIVGTSLQELRAGSDALASGGTHASLQQGSIERGATQKVAFLFTGQGSQYWGMGRELFEAEPAFRAAFEECERALQPHLDLPLSELLYGDASRDGQLLDRTVYTQPALFAIEYALARMLASWGIVPDAVIGHSVGEFAAACVAGVFTLTDAARLIAVRGRLMQSLPAGGAMVAVAADEASVRRTLPAYADSVAIAAINAPDQIVLSGERHSTERLLDELRVPEPERRWLTVSHAFHSPLMRPMLDAFERECSRAASAAARVPFVSNVTGDVVSTLNADYWRRHAAMPVRFADGVKALVATGCSLFVEIGPTPSLLSLAQRSVGLPAAALIPTLRRGRSDANQIARALGALYVAGASVNWRAVHGNVRRPVVTLPTYPFARERYWIEAAPPAVSARHAAAEVRSDATDGAPSAYEVVWREAAPQAIRETSISRWVVLTDGSRSGAAIIEALDRHGWPTVVVSTAEDLDSLCAADAGGTTAFVHACAGQPTASPTTDWLRQYAQEALGSLLRVTQSIARTGIPARLVVVTSGAVQPGPQPTSHQSALWGLARTIGREHPELRPVTIDFEPDRNVEAQIESALADVISNREEAQIAYRMDRRYVARLAKVPPRATVSRLAPSGDATYLVTGGAGGAGLATVEWLAARGARHIAVMGRSEPAPEAAAKMRRIESETGTAIRMVRADVSNEAQLASALAELGATAPPLRGIVHAAGVVADGLLRDQTWMQFERALAPKMFGAWNLHTLTRGLPLDFFVMFSSFAGVAGSAGQSNYTAANAFLDGLAEARRASGLPATAIAWGTWQVGMLAALDAAQRERWSRQGLTTMTPERALSSLDAAVASGKPAVAVVDIDWPRFVAANRREHDPFFQELIESTRNDAAPRPKQSGELFDRVAAAPRTRRRAMLADAVGEEARAILGAGEGVRLDSRRPLRELGMDSLMAVEIRNACAAALGRALPATLLFDYPTIESAADYVLRAHFAEPVAGPAAADARPAEARPDAAGRDGDLAELDNLSAAEAEELLLAELNAVEER
jgi:acyl transferase domain-containing protein